MGRHWKNSDDVTFFTEKATQSRLEKLKMELIPGYAERKRKSYNPKPRNNNYQKRNNQNLKNK